MTRLLLIFGLLLAFTSCHFDEVKYVGVSSISNIKKDGKRISFDADLKIDNPNNSNIVLSPSELDVYLKGKKLGTVFLTKRLKLKKRVEGVYTTSLEIQLESGSLLTIASSALFGKMELTLQGKVRVGNGFIAKKFKVDEAKDINFPALKEFISALLD
jgi:hypothetical protein